MNSTVKSYLQQPGVGYADQPSMSPLRLIDSKSHVSRAVKLTLLPKMQWLHSVLASLLSINLMIGVLSIFRSLSQTGLLFSNATTVFAFLIVPFLLIVMRQLTKCETWIELCVIIICSLHASLFVGWLGITTLLSTFTA